MVRHTGMVIVNIHNVRGHVTVHCNPELDSDAVEVTIEAGDIEVRPHMSVMDILPKGHDPHAESGEPVDGSISIVAAGGISFRLHGCHGTLYGPGLHDEQIELDGQTYQFAT